MSDVKKVNSVGALILNHDSRTLAFSRQRDGNKLGQVGGMVYLGEEVTKALQREIFEETGLSIHIEGEPFFYRDYEEKNARHAVFLVNDALTQTEFPPANIDSNGVSEGRALWVTPKEYIDQKKSAFPEQNKLLLTKAGLLIE